MDNLGNRHRTCVQQALHRSSPSWGMRRRVQRSYLASASRLALPGSHNSTVGGVGRRRQLARLPLKPDAGLYCRDAVSWNIPVILMDFLGE